MNVLFRRISHENKQTKSDRDTEETLQQITSESPTTTTATTTQASDQTSKVLFLEKM